MLGRVRNILPFDVLIMLYYTLIYPYLIYCIIVWGGACTTNLNRLQILQNRAVRLVTRSPFRSSSAPIFAHLNLLQVSDIRRLQIALFLFRCKHFLLPNICLQHCLVNTRLAHDTRHCSTFVMQPFRTNIRGQYVSVIGPKTWETLPVNLRDIKSVFVFKREVVKYFVSNYV